ncbi:MAG TPA: hypothetical protein VE732_04840, partial [Nitrososphaera sp.]|nr:hypothetical protein [Nitrososphaera sp.]
LIRAFGGLLNQAELNDLVESMPLSPRSDVVPAQACAWLILHATSGLGRLVAAGGIPSGES